MNKDQLPRCEGHIVRLRPIARRFSGQQELPQIDDDWRIARVDPARRAVEVRNLRCDHCPTLGFDHIYSYTSDPMRDINLEKHGFLQLLVQVFLTDRGPTIEPLPPGHRSGLTRQAEVPPTGLPTGARVIVTSPGEELSHEEAELLIACSARGEIVRLSAAQCGPWIRAGDHDFVDPGDPAVAAIYVDALEGLVVKGLCRHQSGILYLLTGAGFKVARHLRNLIAGRGG